MKKHVCLLFCILLIISAPVNVYATSAGSVVVAGGSIATGALASGYSSKTYKTAVTLTMALLFSMGVTTKLTSEAISAGKTAYDFVCDKFAQWVGGTSAEEMTESEREELKKRFQVINGGGGSSEDPQGDGVNIGPDGKIYLSAKALQMLKKFIDWLDISDSIGSGGSGDGVTINGLYCPYLSSYTLEGFATWTCNKPCGLFWVYDRAARDRWTIYAVNNQSLSGYRTTQSGNVTEYPINTKRSDYYYGSTGISRLVSAYPVPSDLPMVPESFGYGTNAVSAWLQGASGDFLPETSGGEGFEHDGDFNTDALNNPDNNQTIIDPGLLPTIANDNPGKEYQVSADDYLEAIRQILNQKSNPADVPDQLPVTDVPTGVTVPVDIPADQPADWPITSPSSPTATPDVPTGSTPVVDPTQTPEPADTIKLLKVDLTKIFPFCIPWDIYNLLDKFAADPVTPSIEWDWGNILGFIGVNTVMRLDLHDYDGVAQILRNMETVAFVVGLAYATKKVFVK